MYRLSLIAAIVLLCAALATAAEGEAKTANGATIPPPADGFTWQKIQEAHDPATGKVEIFHATKEGSAEQSVLTFEEAAADTDGKRVARIKADYNGMLASLKEQGHTDIKGTQPPLAAPVPERVWFLLVTKDKDGKQQAFVGALVFGKSTYHFQVKADSPEQAKALADVVMRVKE